MRRRFDTPLPEVCWPQQISLRTWLLSDARAVHALLAHAYRRGGGSVAPYATWHATFTGDLEFDPESCFLAFQGETLAGAALCWANGFLKDLCVAESFRRRGLGAALVAHALHHFEARGLTSVTLKVESDNPSGAQRLYERLGFASEP